MGERSPLSERRTCVLQVKLRGNPELNCRAVAEDAPVQVTCGGAQAQRKDLTRATPVPSPWAGSPGGDGDSQRTRGAAAAAALGAAAALALCVGGALCWRRQRRLREQRGLRPYVEPQVKRGTFSELAIAGPSTDPEKVDDNTLAES